MAHSLDASQTNYDMVGQPSTFSYTVGVTATLLVLALGITSNNARTGGAPTYNGVAMTQVDIARNSDQECVIELWYLLAPATGSNTVSIPNTSGPRTMHAVTSSWISATGQSAFDTGNGNNALTVAPSTAITPLTGSLVVDSTGSGAGTSLTQSLTLIAKSPHLPSWNGGSQYRLSAPGGLESITWSTSPANDDWGHVVGAWKEVAVASTGGSHILSGGGNRILEGFIIR